MVPPTKLSIISSISNTRPIESWVYSIATDAKATKKNINILDIGTGNGVIPLILSLKTGSKITGVEIQSKLADLAKESVKYNKLEDKIDIINADIKDFSSDLYPVINDSLNVWSQMASSIEDKKNS